jgi:hypothetical protein
MARIRFVDIDEIVIVAAHFWGEPQLTYLAAGTSLMAIRRHRRWPRLAWCEHQAVCEGA